MSQGQGKKVYTAKEMESAVELARLGGHMGYFTDDSRDAVNNFIHWAVQFEKTPYDENNWMELIENYGIQKMNESVSLGAATFIMPRVSVSQMKTSLQMFREAGLTMQDCLEVFGDTSGNVHQQSTPVATSAPRMRG